MTGSGPPGPARRVLADAAGVQVITYREGTREGRPLADSVEVVGPDPVELILGRMSGFAVAGPQELCRQLVVRGAAVLRHAHVMSRDLVSDPPPVAWRDLRLAAGLRVVPCDRPAEAVLPAWRAAFPPGHVDHNARTDEQELTEALRPLLAGQILGPLLLPCSGLVVGDRDQVVAGVIVNRGEGAPPMGGPWLAAVFRAPDAAYKGLGVLLIRRTLALGSAAGLPSIGLAVSDANPARQLYERLGFRLISSSMTVVVP